MAIIDTTAGEEYTFGVDLRLSIEVRQNGQLVDPTEVTLIIEKPDQSETVLTLTGTDITRESLGKFYYDADLDQAGTWEYRWKTTSPKGARESYFVVPASRVATP